MRFKELDTVVLNRDRPGQRLRKGDLGAVVHVFEPDGLEVEFVSASGRTEALVTLTRIIREDVVRPERIALESRSCRGGARRVGCKARGYPRPEGPWVAAIQWRESPRRSNDADGPPGHPAKLGRAVGDPAEGWVGQLHE
jgi:hypothetical protein